MWQNITNKLSVEMGKKVAEEHSNERKVWLDFTTWSYDLNLY